MRKDVRFQILFLLRVNGTEPFPREFDSQLAHFYKSSVTLCKTDYNILILLEINNAMACQHVDCFQTNWSVGSNIITITVNRLCA